MMSDNKKRKRSYKYIPKFVLKKKYPKKCKTIVPKKRQRPICFYKFLLNVCHYFPDVIVSIICEYAIIYNNEYYMTNTQLRDKDGIILTIFCIDVTENNIYVLNKSNDRYDIRIFDKNDFTNPKKIILVDKIPRKLIVYKEEIYLFTKKCFRIINKNTGKRIRTFNKWKRNESNFTKISVATYSEYIYILDDIYYKKNQSYSVYIFNKNIKKFVNNFTINLRINLNNNFLYFSPIIAVDDTKFYIAGSINNTRDINIYGFDIKSIDKIINLSAPIFNKKISWYTNDFSPLDLSLIDNELFVIDAYYNGVMVFNKFTGKYVRSFFGSVLYKPRKIQIFDNKIYIIDINYGSISIWKRTPMLTMIR
jgi:hypothetical protein